MKPTRDSFVHLWVDSHHEWSPDSPEPRLVVKRAAAFDGFEACAIWPSSSSVLKCGGKTIEEAQDGLLENDLAPPPKNTTYFFWARAR